MNEPVPDPITASLALEGSGKTVGQDQALNSESLDQNDCRHISGSGGVCCSIWWKGKNIRRNP